MLLMNLKELKSMNYSISILFLNSSKPLAASNFTLPLDIAWKCFFAHSILILSTPLRSNERVLPFVSITKSKCGGKYNGLRKYL